MSKKEEGKRMLATQQLKKEPKPIPKTSIGMTKKQKDILKSYVGKMPNLPVDLNTVRDWEKNGDN